MAEVAVMLAGGLLLLAVAPDRFVAGSAGLADRWGISRVVIGAVVIGFGTSSPELLVSTIAAAQGEPGVGVGNIVGSNMANLALVVGTAAFVGRLAISDGLLRREVPLVAAATVLFAFLVQGGLSPLEGLVLGGALAVALVVLIRGSIGRPRSAGEAELAAEVEEFLAEEEEQGWPRLAWDTGTGLVGTLAGAQLLVTGAVELAASLDLSDGFVGMTVVAVGTSLPELVTAVAAARTGEDQLVLGNVLGSNLFNCLGVGAVVGLAGTGPLTDTALTVDAVLLMLAITALSMTAMARRRLVTRHEAAMLLVAYAGFMPFLAR